MENSKNIIKNAEKSLQKEFEIIEEIRDRKWIDLREKVG